MLSSAETARDAVMRTLVAMERLCLDADAAFVERRWADVAASIQTQAQLTEALRRLFADAPEAGPGNDAKVAQRIRGIMAFRDDQLRRMRAYNDEIRVRLDALGKLKALSRTVGRADRGGQLLDGQY